MLLVLEWKERTFYRKSELQMFLLISGGHIGAPIWRLHTKLYKGAWNVSANNSETVGHKNLTLIVYKLVFYSILASWLVAWQWKRSIHHFHIDHNAPCLPPKLLHNYCLRFLFGRLRNWKQKFCKILEGKQGSLWSMWKWWIDISGALAVSGNQT